MTTGFCDRLRLASEPLWSELLNHPFVAGLADGTLSLEHFRFYLEQDRLYLLDFARVIAIAAARAADEAELRWFSGVLRQTLDEELVENGRLHARLLALGAPDRGGSRELGPAAGSYSSFLQQVGFRGSLLELTVALLPCPWSYAEIGRRYGNRAIDHPIYADWFAYQSSPEAQAFAEQMIAIVDARAAGLGAAQFDLLAATFRAATRHELAFWDASYDLTQWPTRAIDSRKPA